MSATRTGARGTARKGKGARVALIFSLLACAIPAHATIAHVAHDAFANGSTSASISVTTTAGNLAAVCVEWVATTRTATVSGNNSGAYTASAIGKLTNGSTVASELFYKQNAAADTTITVTCTSCTSVNAGYMEFSGAATSGGEDGTASNTGTSTTPSTGPNNLTSTGTTNVALGCGAISIGTDTWTAGSGFTESTSLPARVGFEWQIFTSAINQTVGFTLTSTSTAWIVSADSFKAAGGGAACTPTLTLLGVGRCG